MSRLAHSELYLTFRDWSSSGSDHSDEDNNNHWPSFSDNEQDSDNMDNDIEEEMHTENNYDDSETGFANNDSIGQSVLNHFTNIEHQNNSNNLNTTNIVNSENGNNNNNNSNNHDNDTGINNAHENHSGNRIVNPSAVFRTVDIFNVVRLNQGDEGRIDSDNDNNNENRNNLNSYSSAPFPPILLQSPTTLGSFYDAYDFSLNDINTNNIVYGSSTFFKNHPQHEILYEIPTDMQKYGLISMLNELLVYRNNFHLKDSDINVETYDNNTKKRSFNQICLDDTNLNFLQNKTDSPNIINLSPSSFLKSGSVFSLPIELSGANVSLRFTNVNYNNLTSSGYFQFGNTKLGFSGEIVDFLHSDLRLNNEKRFIIEGNVYNNLLRNKLVHSKRFEKYFDLKKKKCYTRDNWKPFSMNRMGYIVSNSKRNKPFKTKTNIDAIRPKKFPNSSVLHKFEALTSNKFDTYKLLSKWFELPPLNQFINTPSPPTPPNRHNKYTNNPENLLVCKDCVNLIMSKFLFLKLEIDIDDLFSKSKNLKIRPDFIYKHRRRFYIYANKLMSKSNSNFRRHIAQQSTGHRFSSENNPYRWNTFDSSSDEEEEDCNLNLEGSINEDINIKKDGVHDQVTCEMDNNNNADENFDYGNDYDDDNNNSNKEAFLLMTADNDLAFDSHPVLPTQIDRLEISDDDNDDADENTSIFSDDRFDFNDDESINEENNSNSENMGYLSVWPISDERNAEHHPIIDPIDTSELSEDDNNDLENPYDFVFSSNRSTRVSRLLFNINMVRDQRRQRKDPISSLKLYKTGQPKMNMILLVCINRNTGDLHLLPGNMDVNLWSTEQSDGELFEDVETFSKVFHLFMDMEQTPTCFDSSYVKKIKKWIKKKRFQDAEQIRKLLILQLLTNPSIINGFGLRREKIRKENLKKKMKDKSKKYVPRTQRENDKFTKLNKKKGKTNTTFEKFKDGKHDGNSNKTRINHEDNCFPARDQILNDELREQLLNFIDENDKLNVDNSKVITFKHGKYSPKSRRRQNALYSFDYA
jgi:hypothetical protein